MSEKPRIRDRKYCAVLYPEDPTHFACIEKLKTGGYTYALILHDQDVYEDGDQKGQLKKPHWHVVVKFTNAVWQIPTAKALGIEPNYLQPCASVDGALLYLVHDGNPDKYQYSLDDVEGPLKSRLITLLAEDDEGTKAVKICDIVDATPGPIGYSEVIRKAHAAGLYDTLRRMGSLGVEVVRDHNREYYHETQINAGAAADAYNFRKWMAGPWKEVI